MQTISHFFSLYKFAFFALIVLCLTSCGGTPPRPTPPKDCAGMACFKLSEIFPGTIPCYPNRVPINPGSTRTKINNASSISPKSNIIKPVSAVFRYWYVNRNSDSRDPTPITGIHTKGIQFSNQTKLTDSNQTNLCMYQIINYEGKDVMGVLRVQPICATNRTLSDDQRSDCTFYTGSEIIHSYVWPEYISLAEKQSIDSCDAICRESNSSRCRVIDVASRIDSKTMLSIKSFIDLIKDKNNFPITKETILKLFDQEAIELGRDSDITMNQEYIQQIGFDSIKSYKFKYDNKIYSATLSLPSTIIGILKVKESDKKIVINLKLNRNNQYINLHIDPPLTPNYVGDIKTIEISKSNFYLSNGRRCLSLRYDDSAQKLY